MLARFTQLLAAASYAVARVQVNYKECSLGTKAAETQRLNFEAVYAQWDAGQRGEGQLPSSLQSASLKLVALGHVDTQDPGYSSVVSLLLRLASGENDVWGIRRAF